MNYYIFSLEFLELSVVGIAEDEAVGIIGYIFANKTLFVFW